LSDSSARDALLDLKLNYVKQLCSDKIYARGLKYYKDGRVSNQLIQNNLLSCQVQGSQFNYDVNIKVENGKLIPNCTCPYDFEDFCKHSISLLANWIIHPEQFTDIDLFFEEMEKKNKDELLSIMKRWIHLYPDIVLKYYSNQSLKGLKNKLQYIFSFDGSESYDVPTIIQELKDFNQILEEYEKKNDLESFNNIKYIVEFCFAKLPNFDYAEDIESFIEMLIKIYVKVFQNLEVDWTIKKEIHEFNLKIFIESPTDTISEIISKAIAIPYFETEMDFVENLILNKIELNKKNKKSEYYLLSKLVLLILDLYEQNKDYEKFTYLCEKEPRYCYNRYIQYLESIGAFDKAIL